MMIFVLALLGGLLTILSPCVLPIVPIAFSNAGRSRGERALMFTGLTVTFALLATAATLSAGWIAAASEGARWIALVFLALVALTLISERAAVLLTRPFVRLGAGLDGAARRTGGRTAALLTGAAIGLLWAPCAGPILALLIVGGRATGNTAMTLALLVAFGIGASAALAVVLFAGQRLMNALRRSLAADRIVRVSLGVVALAAVVAIALGWDKTFLAKGDFIRTAAGEELLVKRFGKAPSEASVLGESLDGIVVTPAPALQDEGAMPPFPAGYEWINSGPLTADSLKGKVVMVEFWAFECINCLNALPHVLDLYDDYKAQGFVVIGVHTPELPRERIPANVHQAVKDLGITYPVVIDPNYDIWRAWNNQYWPAAYFVDAKGRVRYHHFGEGKYEEQDAVVRKLLAEAKATKR
jgi:cytochrome c biogenesis protein CcdA/thiol-disulfide isomerase/thioredoxin